jgi:hypothetical protein
LSIRTYPDRLARGKLESVTRLQVFSCLPSFPLSHAGSESWPSQAGMAQSNGCPNKFTHANASGVTERRPGDASWAPRSRTRCLSRASLRPAFAGGETDNHARKPNGMWERPSSDGARVNGCPQIPPGRGPGDGGSSETAPGTGDLIGQHENPRVGHRPIPRPGLCPRPR